MLRWNGIPVDCQRPKFNISASFSKPDEGQDMLQHCTQHTNCAMILELLCAIYFAFCKRIEAAFPPTSSSNIAFNIVAWQTEIG